MSKEGGNIAESVVVSHRKDADGISSAALVRNTTGAKIYLSDYGDLGATLSRVPSAKHVYICDLGLNAKTFELFYAEVTRLSSSGIVHYIDHHPINSEYRSKLVTAGVDLYHSTEESAAVLVFRKFEENLKNSPEMKIIASCGAITDYLDNRPYAKKLISLFDRQFLLYEATILSFTIAMIGRGSAKSNSLLVNLSKRLSSGMLPHEVDGASSYAQTYVRRSAKLMEELRRHGKRGRNFAYYLTKESATGNVANFLIGAFNVPIGVAFREEEPGYYEVSLRSIEESKHDLGKIVTKISLLLRTSGGGHFHASGIRIKQDQLEEFLSMLDGEFSKDEATN